MTANVLHLIQSAGLYGAENVILTLARLQNKSAKATPIIGCIVDDINEPSDLYDAAVGEGLTAIKLVMPIKLAPFLFNSTVAQCRQLAIHMIHCHGYKPSVFGFVIAKRIGIPIVATCHNWIIPNNAPFKMRLMIRIEKYLYRFFNRVIAVSEPVFITLKDSNIPASNLALIFNGISFEEFKGSLVTRESLDLNEDHFVIINTARLTAVKNQAWLITIVAALVNEYSNIRLLLVGEGEDRKSLKNLTQELGIEEKVKFLGFQSQVRALLALSDCFCLSSNDEGLPMSLLEATASKTAVISTNVGSVSAVIEDGVSGFLIEPGDSEKFILCLRQYLENPLLRQEFSNSAYQQVRDKFSDEKMHDQYQTIYDEVLAR